MLSLELLVALRDVLFRQKLSLTDRYFLYVSIPAELEKDIGHLHVPKRRKRTMLLVLIF